jgi:hypothetical protein
MSVPALREPARSRKRTPDTKQRQRDQDVLYDEGLGWSNGGRGALGNIGIIQGKGNLWPTATDRQEDFPSEWADYRSQ